MSLPPDLEQFVEQQVSSAAFPSRDAVMIEAVRLMREFIDPVARLRREINDRMDAMNRGDGIEIKGDEELRQFFDDLAADVEHELNSGKS